MKILETKVYFFNELNEEAKKRAIETLALNRGVKIWSFQKKFNSAFFYGYSIKNCSNIEISLTGFSSAKEASNAAFAYIINSNIININNHKFTEEGDLI
jgi:hypothetical protein